VHFDRCTDDSTRQKIESGALVHTHLLKTKATAEIAEHADKTFCCFCHFAFLGDLGVLGG